METAVTRVGALAFALLITAAPLAAQHANRAGAAAAEAPFKTPTIAMASDGSLWRVWVERKQVLVSVSNDRGRLYTAPVRVTRSEEAIDANGESRPKIALGPSGEVVCFLHASGSATLYEGHSLLAIGRWWPHLRRSPHRQR